MRIQIDLDRCEGHAMCAQSAPDYVQLDDEGYPQVLERAVPEPVPGPLDLARRACPASAFSLSEEPAG